MSRVTQDQLQQAFERVTQWSPDRQASFIQAVQLMEDQSADDGPVEDE